MTDQDYIQSSIPEGPSGPTNVSDYKFEPIKGYPMLNWKGKRPFTATHYYPAQLKEVYGQEVDGWRNKIFWGDNLQVMSHLLKDYRGKVDLVYIDPPFDSKADYKKTISLRGTEVSNDHTSFEDKQYSDIWTNDEYLQFMYERLILIRELLSDQGSIYLHCDWRMNSFLRMLMDEIFGSQNILNEVIWYYRRWNIASNIFARNHDCILFYAKSAGNHKFNNLFIPKSEKSSAQGKAWKSIIGEDGIRRSIMTDEPTKGVPMPDTWEISIINPVGKERTEIGYPTQKPEALLERIISASSNLGDLILDCFMGSGTTQAVALKLGRRFIGADINVGAIQTTTKRLLNIIEDQQDTSPQASLLDQQETQPKMYSGFEIYNVNHYDIFRNPAQAKDLLISALELNQFAGSNLYDGEKDGRLYKIMPVNRIATRADLNELIAGFDLKSFDRRQAQKPGKPVENITLVCMGHEPDLGANLINEAKPFLIDVEVVDILRDRQDLQFKRDSEAKIVKKDGYLVIEAFYPMNLLQKLSIQKENVRNWREMVDSIMVDWNYDGAVLQPTVVDIPEKNELVKGKYKIPSDAGTIKVEITDLLSESLEVEVP